MEVISESGDSRYDLRSKTKKNVGNQILESSSALNSLRAKEVEAGSLRDCKPLTCVGHGKAPKPRVWPEAEAAQKKPSRQCTELALKKFNTYKKVGEYELVEIIGVVPFLRGMEGFWYHANFRAKPKSASDTESKSFFAELRHTGGSKGFLKCVKCCILGSLDYGFMGCSACEKSRMMVRHPADGFHPGVPPHCLY